MKNATDAWLVWVLHSWYREPIFLTLLMGGLPFLHKFVLDSLAKYHLTALLVG